MHVSQEINGIIFTLQTHSGIILFMGILNYLTSPILKYLTSIRKERVLYTQRWINIHLVTCAIWNTSNLFINFRVVLSLAFQHWSLLTSKWPLRPSENEVHTKVDPHATYEVQLSFPFGVHMLTRFDLWWPKMTLSWPFITFRK